MHILVTTYGFPTKNTKGNPFVKELAEALARKGIKATVIQFVFINPIELLKSVFLFKPITNWQKSDGVTIINSYYINFIPNFSLLFNIKKRLILFSVQIRFRIYIFFNGKPDFIQQHYTVNAQPWITEYLSKKFSIPYVLFEHSPIASLEGVEKKLHSYFSKQNLLLFAKNASARIARSEKYARIYETAFGCPFIIIPNLVAENYLKKSLPKFPKSTMPFIFLSIGTLLPNKSHARLIKAFVLKFKEMENTHLRIAGDGPLRKELAELIQQYSMEKRIHLLGLLDREKIFQVIDESNVIVVSSDRETFGNTLIEGLFRGLPVISTRCGGPEEIINETNGLLAEKNEEDLGAKMYEMYKNYNRYNPHKIIEETRSKYSEEVVTKKILELYASLK